RYSSGDKDTEPAVMRRSQVSLQSASRRRTSPERMLAYGATVLLTMFMITPLYLITIAAFSQRASVFDYPRALFPTQLSLDSVSFFLTTHGILPALERSLLVGLITVALSLLLGCPAGYAIARYPFKGRDLAQLLLLSVRMFPALVLAIPLAVTFIEWRLFHTPWGVAFLHTAMALPVTVLLSARVFLPVPGWPVEAPP